MGRNADESDYADYTESCAARWKILTAIYRCKGELQFAPTIGAIGKTQNPQNHSIRIIRDADKKAGPSFESPAFF
jgi:hypothetical protein